MCTLTLSALMREYFSVFTHQCRNYPLPATLSVAQRQRDTAHVSNPPLQSQNKFTLTWLTMAFSSTHLKLCLPVPVSVLCQFWSSCLCQPIYSLSPVSPLVSGLQTPALMWIHSAFLQDSLSKLQNFHLFFFPPPLCGCWPVSSVRASGLDGNIFSPNLWQNSALDLLCLHFTRKIDSDLYITVNPLLFSHTFFNWNVF